ncbi:C-terminal binding protein [Bacteroidota bacterium]
MRKKVVMPVETGGFTVEDFPEELEAEFIISPSKNEDEVISLTWDADAIITSVTPPITKRIIDSLRKCQLIHFIGAGYDSIDVEAATDAGICVSYAGDYCAEEVAEHTVALMLACTRKIVRLDRAVRQGKWDSIKRQAIREIWHPMYRINGQVLGLIGFGQVAKLIVPKASGLGVKIIAYDPLLSDDIFDDLGVERVALDELLSRSDYVSINCALVPETEHLLDLEQFKKMKVTAYLINAARGGIICESDLHKALSDGYIAGAALDVIEEERVGLDNPLLQLDNVILTAHSAFYSEQSGSLQRQRAYEQIGQVFRGEWPTWLANPEVKDKYKE